ncbi:MAG TPA: hypothetical protein VFJ19_16100 [Nocardioidaceae bacterium]|nr:hypothetical protein [Nocardioidaceae bacterium]
MLACRRQVLLSLTERLDHLAGEVPSLDEEARCTIRGVISDPLLQLTGLVHRLARDRGPDASLSEVLQRRLGGKGEIDNGSDHWRLAARELFLATSELTRADEQPWLYRRDASRHVLADLADTAQAVVALDARLASAGMLPEVPPRRTAERLLVAMDVGRVARLLGSDPSADQASASWTVATGGRDTDIVMVRHPEDYIAAQRRLARLVQPVRTDAAAFRRYRPPGLKSARGMALGQVRLAVMFAEWAERTPGADLLANQFRDRIPAYRALHASTAKLIDAEPRRSPIHLLQQSEMITQARAMAGQSLSEPALAALNEATHELTVSVGKALRRQGMQLRSIQRQESDEVGLPIATPITNTRHAFNIACKALADDPAPPARNEDPEPPVHRLRLRLALDDFVQPVRQRRALPQRRRTPASARTL